MEPIKQNPHDIRPGQPGRPQPVQPVRPRPLVSDFAPRPAGPGGPALRPMQPGGVQSPAAPSTLRPAVTPPEIGASLLAPPDTAAQKTEEASPPELPQPPEPKPPKERSQTAHAGLVGLVVFIALTAVLLLPLLPGKVLDNFPGSSQSFSTGDQSLACLTALGKIKTTQTYDSKLGFPIVYKYSTTTTQQATCQGKVQTATGGHSSQFNPLGGAIDIAASLVVALIVVKIWRKLFGQKHHY